MLKNFWYAVEFSAKLTSEKPLGVTLMGQAVALYRQNDGRVVALNDRCVHRGGSLARGVLEDNCLRCPYHGWKYQADGRCVEIPANPPEAPVPQKARVESYPVQEKYGYIWLFMGDLPEEARPPLPAFPDLLDPTLRPIWGEFKWNAHYTRVVENGCDMSHTAFVHSNAFGNRRKPQTPKPEIKVFDWGASATIITEPRRARGLLRRRVRDYNNHPTVRLTAAFYLPNLTLIEVIAPNNFKIVNIGSHIPVDEDTTLTKWVQLRNFLPWCWVDWDARRRGSKIFAQDAVVVEPQLPRVVPYDLSAELHIPSDALHIEYRKMRNKYLDMGWGVGEAINSSKQIKNLLEIATNLSEN